MLICATAAPAAEPDVPAIRGYVTMDFRQLDSSMPFWAELTPVYGAPGTEDRDVQVFLATVHSDERTGVDPVVCTCEWTVRDRILLEMGFTMRWFGEIVGFSSIVDLRHDARAAGSPIEGTGFVVAGGGVRVARVRVTLGSRPGVEAGSAPGR
jgi:hypothetical protein